jgi:hypothetical protein
MQEQCKDSKSLPAPELGEIGKYSFDEKTSLNANFCFAS